jgi:hypothetical protein
MFTLALNHSRHLLEEKNSTMAKNDYLKPHKTTLTTWVDKALQKSLKKENIKSRCNVSGI